jgi:alpha-amylase
MDGRIMNTMNMKHFLIGISLIASLAALSGCSKNAQKTQDWTVNTVVYELNVRQATAEGTFKAAEKKLPMLKSVQADIIWLMPIYPIGEKGRKGTLGSYYAIKDYCDVNPEFGSLEDFDHFLKAAHEMGFKVILDWVANHTSPDNAWVTEKPADWYVRDSLGNTVVEYDWTDIAKLNYGSKEMRAEMEKSMRFWLDRGIDGFRCDVASEVPKDFWTDVFRKFRNDYHRRLYFLAEGEDEWLHEAGFDATYSWKLKDILNKVSKDSVGTKDILEYIDWNKETYPAGAYRLTFTSNHDENSWSGSEFERLGDAWQAMTILCWTLPNAQPLIYTGQEVGYDHRFQFFEKDPMPDKPQNDTTEFYINLSEFKHAHKALRSDNSNFAVSSQTDSSLSYIRWLDGDTVNVAIQFNKPWAYSLTSPTPEGETVALIFGNPMGQ